MDSGDVIFFTRILEKLSGYISIMFFMNSNVGIY